MHVYLRIKARELAYEAKINKQEQEKSVKKAYKALKKGKDRTYTYHMKQFYGIREHLRNVVRQEARLTNIARGFLNNTEYMKIERWCYKPLTAVEWDYIADMVMKYGEEKPNRNQSIQERWDEWLHRAKHHATVWYYMDKELQKEVIRKLCPLKAKKQFSSKEEAKKFYTDLELIRQMY